MNKNVVFTAERLKQQIINIISTFFILESLSVHLFRTAFYKLLFFTQTCAVPVHKLKTFFKNTTMIIKLKLLS